MFLDNHARYCPTNKVNKDLMARIISVKIFRFVEARAVCGYMDRLHHTFQHYAIALGINNL